MLPLFSKAVTLVFLSDLTGGRGINVYRLTDGTYDSVDELFGNTSPWPSADFLHFDMAQFCGSDIGSYQTRADAMLIPTKTGLYEFQLKSDYQAQLYFEGVSGEKSYMSLEKTGLREFRPCLTQAGLYSHRRWLKA